MAQQLRFNLEAKPALGREDFFVSPANQIAVAAIESWQNWPDRKLVLTGPNRSGKTHLAHVWASQTDARIVRSTDLKSMAIDELALGAVAVEDVPAMAGDGDNERALFHLHNLMRAEQRPLLLTAEHPASYWPLTLPDLASRMQGTNSVALGPPDDELFAAVLMKLFTDRQINPEAGTLEYLLDRIDRSFATAEKTVERLDEAAMELRRKVNKSLATKLHNDGKLDFPTDPA